MRTTTALTVAAVATLLTLTGCTGTGQVVAPSPTAGSPAASPTSAADLTAVGLGDGWQEQPAPEVDVQVCGATVVPTGSVTTEKAFRSPAGHRVTVLVVDVAASPAAATQRTADVFANCASTTDGDNDVFAWSYPSATVEGGHTGQVASVTPEMVTSQARAAATAAVDGDTVALAVLEADEDQGAGTEKLGTYTEAVLAHVLAVAGGAGADGPVPSWEELADPVTSLPGEPLPGPQGGTGPMETEAP